jgi:HK97 family phage portal protein
MDLLGQLLTPQHMQANWAPDDDRWYQPIGYGTTVAGVRVDAEGAKKISAWFRGRDILATSLAMLPLPLYERGANDDGPEVARNHQLYDVLHRKPAPDEDSFTWRRQAMFDLVDCGHFYSWINIGARWELPRIEPRLVTREKVKSGPNKGRTVYHVRDETTQTTKAYTRDDVFHLKGADGKGILESAAESLGLSMVTEQYAGRIYSRGFLNGGVIEVAGPMDDDSMKAMANSFVRASSDWHLPSILPLGAKMASTEPLTPEKAQMLLSRKFSINEIARWLGLPPHMIGDLERSTNNNIEHQGQEFVTYSLGPWLSLWEFGINDQLILQPNRFYAEFTRDALVRGDIAARWEAYMKAVTTGTFTRNEVRRLEGKKKLPGLDEPLDPTNITGGGSANEPKQPAKAPRPSTSTKAEFETADRARAIVHESAARVLRKETAAIQKAAVRCASDGEAFALWLHEFYGAHASLVAQTMVLDDAQAVAYCAIQCAEVLEDGISVMEAWTPDYLASLALDSPKPVQPPHIEVHSPVTISEGAVQTSVQTPDILVQAPITVQPQQVTIAKGAVTVERGAVTIEEGAIKHESTIAVPKAGPSKVTKRIKRDAKHQIAEVIEEHE